MGVPHQFLVCSVDSNPGKNGTMEMDDSEQEEGNAGATGGLRLELVKSYLGFARRAIRARWKTSAAVFTIGIALTIATVKYSPKTFACTTVLMAQSSGVLDGRDGSNALAGAEGIILRQENLETIVRDVGLVKSSVARRPPLMRFKDRILSSLFGEMDDKTRLSSLVGTLESRIGIDTEKGQLSIRVEWSDAATTAEVAEAARESFLRARHAAEISAFEDKMSILDGHASKMRDDIGTLAQQIRTARDDQANRARAARKPAAPATDAPADAPVARRVVQQVSGGADPQVPALKEKLATLKAKLGGVEAERDARVRAEQAKYDDLKLRFTSNHPEMVMQRERIAMASQVSSEVALMQAEAKDIQGEIEQREGLAKQGGSVTSFIGGGKRPAAAGVEPLPAEIADLLVGEGDLDPALTAQLSTAVTKYSALRSDLFSTQVDLDTAQAAFNHRYQVIVPAEPPGKAFKPKPTVIFGAGFALALLIALLLPVLSELRADIITERWQAEHIALPVLAELRLPPHSAD